MTSYLSCIFQVMLEFLSKISFCGPVPNYMVDTKFFEYLFFTKVGKWGKCWDRAQFWSWPFCNECDWYSWIWYFWPWPVWQKWFGFKNIKWVENWNHRMKANFDFSYFNTKFFYWIKINRLENRFFFSVISNMRQSLLSADKPTLRVFEDSRPRKNDFYE